MSTTLTLPDLYNPIEDALDRVRDGIRQLWQDALSLAGFSEDTVPSPGGKLLRPALCLLSAGAIGGRDLKQYAPLATAFEALHIASLAHDDVLDRALLRRGQKSLNALWNNHAAVLGGDYLVARAVELMADYDRCAVIANAIQSVRCMAEGELFFFNKADDDVREEDCIRLAEQKTASLFAEACSAPTFIIDDTHRTALHGFGMALGTAFQLVDDTLDVTRSTGDLGKASCGDVAEGKQTLPIMYMRAAMGPADRDRLKSMHHAEITDADRQWIMEMAERTGARQQAETITRSYADHALDCLRALPASPYRDSMEGIVEFVLVRPS